MVQNSVNLKFSNFEVYFWIVKLKKIKSSVQFFGKNLELQCSKFKSMYLYYMGFIFKTNYLQQKFKVGRLDFHYYN